jgi:3alpha(or 20beta)-hydroxysteroid dehydrogenase
LNERIIKRFHNRTVIVTGGARGMGASFARGFAADGAKVVIADVLEQEGRRLAAELADHAIFSRLDVTSDRDWAATWLPPRTHSVLSLCWSTVAAA